VKNNRVECHRNSEWSVTVTPEWSVTVTPVTRTSSRQIVGAIKPWA
jgi:hypothetical protein